MANTTVYPYGTGGGIPSSIGIINDLRTGGADKALSAQQGKVIGDNLYPITQIDISTLVESEYIIGSNNTWATGDSSRSVFLLCTPGRAYTFVNNSGRTANVAPLKSVEWAGVGTTPKYATGYSDKVTLADGESVTITAPGDAKSFYIRTKNSGGNDDAPDVYMVVDKLNDAVSNITELEKVASVNGEYGNVIMGSFINKSNDSEGLPGSDSTTRAGMVTTLALPYSGVTFNFKMPPYYVAGIRHGAKAQNLSTNSYWFADGETFTFPSSSNYYRIIFAIQPFPDVSQYETISAATVESLIASGEISVTYKKIDQDAVKRNAPSDCYAKAMIYKYYTAAGSGMDKFPIFIHTTDIHGDAYRLQDAVDMAAVYNADGILASGDFNANTVKNDFEAIETIMKDSSVPSLYCRGNHETYGNSDTSFDVFTKYYSALATKWNYLKSSGTVTDKTYYYMDFTSKQIRIIVLDPYEGNLTTNNAGAYSQAQIDWFIATLKSTPANYGILCMMHTPEAYPSTTLSIEPIDGKDDFFLEDNPLYFTTPTGISGTPLRDIVDNFISRQAVSFTFTQTITGGTTETITVSGDFTSGINTGVEFIAWVSGHEHIDLVGVYKDTANRQVVLNMTCGTCFYGPSDYPYLCNESELPRGSFGVVQDAINVYAIDRVNKQIRIARIGSNFTNKLKKREAMIINYAD